MFFVFFQINTFGPKPFANLCILNVTNPLEEKKNRLLKTWRVFHERIRYNGRSFGSRTDTNDLTPSTRRWKSIGFAEVSRRWRFSLSVLFSYTQYYIPAGNKVVTRSSLITCQNHKIKCSNIHFRRNINGLKSHTHVLATRTQVEAAIETDILIFPSRSENVTQPNSCHFFLIHILCRKKTTFSLSLRPTLSIVLT